MIKESIQAYRARRKQEARLGRVQETKARLGLASRQADQTTQDMRAAARSAKQPAEGAYDPAAKIRAWYEEIEAIRSERGYGADQESSTTGAMDENPLASPRPKDLTNRWDGPAGLSGGAGGRAAAEEYLGRPMEDNEWEMLARTTYAEATDDPEEQAAIMSVILNRAKADNYPDSIVEVVNQPNQFQAVTGTAGNRQPSSRFKAFNDDVLSLFESDVTPRLGNFSDTGWLNFTASNPAAYGEGTNIGFMDQVNNSEGSAQIGGTLFGTVRG